MDNTNKNNGDGQKIQSAFNLFGPSFRALWLNIVPLVCITFLPAFVFGLLAVLMISASFLSGDGSNNGVLVGFTLFVGFLAVLFLLLVVLPATFYLQLAGAKGNKLNIENTIKDSFRLFPRIIGLCIVVGFIVLIGLLLFIVPGIFMIKRYLFSAYFLMDENLGIFESMRRSKELSKQFSGPVWALMGVTLLVQIAGWIISLVPILGQIVSLVLTTVYGYAPAVRYVELKKAKS